MQLGTILWLASMLPHALASQTCLATTVYLEARNQSTIGQMAVAEVTMRRLDEGRWGHTVCQVVTKPHQFAPGFMSKSFEINNAVAFKKAWNIAGKMLANWKLPASKRHLVIPHANFFATTAVSPAWERKPRRHHDWCPCILRGGLKVGTACCPTAAHRAILRED